MSVAEKAAALLELLGSSDLESMVPAARRRLAARCLKIAEASDRMDRTTAKAGVLARLDRGERAP